MNQKAIEAACDQSAQSPGGVKAAVSAYLSTIWRPFDPDKPETWPAGKRAPSGLEWLYVDSDGEPNCGEFEQGGFVHNGWSITRKVKRYLDPADLMPGGE